MIEIVKSPSSKIFYGLVKESTAQLLLCAPYIKKEVVKEILALKKGQYYAQRNYFCECCKFC